MRELFGLEVGLSDHTHGIGVSLAAVALGATVIEKHFTLDRNDGGVDSAFSIEPAELKLLVEESERVWQSLGSVKYGATEQEKPSLRFRRSLYIVEDIKAGEAFTETNLRSIRPGYGLSPKYYDKFLGKKVKEDIKRGTPLSWDLLV
jgi:N-acetylneuraminate synthase